MVINKKDEEMRELKQSKKELESQVSFLKLENSESERNFQKQLSELALQNNQLLQDNDQLRDELSQSQSRQLSLKEEISHQNI